MKTREAEGSMAEWYSRRKTGFAILGFGDVKGLAIRTCGKPLKAWKSKELDSSLVVLEGI